MPYRKNRQTVTNSAGELEAKDCPCCKRMLNIVEYSFSESRADGLSSTCRLCTKRRREVRTTDDARKRIMLSRVKSFAKKHNLPFNLTIEDIAIPPRCPVLGIELEFGIGDKTNGWRDNSPSIDRIFPIGGYTRGNIVVISYRANRIKNDASPAELRKVADFYGDIQTGDFKYSVSDNTWVVPVMV